MSQIRRVQVLISDEESLIDICKKMGLTVERKKNDIFLFDHGIDTYLPDDKLTLKKNKDGYVLLGDCYKKDLEDLRLKIKIAYTEKMIKDTAHKKGLSLYSKTEKNGKIKIVYQS